MKRVLMIAFHWPPLGGSAAVRNVNMAETLRTHGWEPTVVHGGRWRGYPTDARLGSDIDSVEAWAPSARVNLFPDRQLLWLPFAVMRGLKAIHRGARAIWTTSPPETGHLAGAILKRITGRPWIMDYNVEWSTNPATRWWSRWQQRRHQSLESRLLRRVDAVCSLSSRHLERLPVPVRSVVVEAGYDGRRFAPTPRRPWRIDRPFVVTHTGSLFGVQHPGAFVDALNSLVQEGAVPAGHVVARFIGNLWEGAEHLKRAKFRVETRSLVPHDEIPATLAESDLLLVSLSSEAECVVPNKLYEYMAAGRPILAIAPAVNPVTRMIEQTRTGVAVEPSDRGMIRAALLAFFMGKVPYAPDAAAVASYELRPTIGKLAALLDDLAA